MKPAAWKLLVTAIAVGVAGDTLLRGGMWRTGFALWIAMLAGCVILLAPRAPRERLLLIVGIVLAAFGLVYRDAPMLYVIDLLALLCTAVLTLWIGGGRQLTELTLVEAPRAGVIAIANTVGGGFGVLRRVSDERALAVTDTARGRALVIGSVLAVPPFVIVLSLLASSDIVFGRTLTRLGEALGIDGLGHVAVAMLIAWVAAGILSAALGDAIGNVIPSVRSPGLPFIAVAVGVYAQIALLLAFIATQARVLFGGTAYLRDAEGLTIATYARSGFFQLILAAGVVLFTLVIAEWLLARDDVAGRRRYSRAATVLLMMVATLLVSSAARIWLYVSEFGISVDRAMAVAGIVWVAAALVTFAVTTLRGHAERFAPWSVWVAVLWVALVNVTNPEMVVARSNIARGATRQDFDVAYHARLSADAVPMLRRAAERLPRAACERFGAELQLVWRERLAAMNTEGADWRAMDLPLWQVREWMASGGAISCASP
jgi:hypothetical protein